MTMSKRFNVQNVFDIFQIPELEEVGLLDTTVFEDIIELFESLTNDMLKNTVNYVFTDVQARTLPYRRDKSVYIGFYHLSQLMRMENVMN